MSECQVNHFNFIATSSVIAAAKGLIAQAGFWQLDLVLPIPVDQSHGAPRGSKLVAGSSLVFHNEPPIRPQEMWQSAELLFNE